MQFPCPLDLPSDGHRCLKQILPKADSGPASSLFRASLYCCPAFTSEPAHRIYTAASDPPSRLLPLSSSLFIAPSRSRPLPPALPLRPNRADGRDRDRHRPTPARWCIPHGGSGSVRPTLPRRGGLPCCCGPRCCSQPNPNSVAFVALPLRRPPPPASSSVHRLRSSAASHGKEPPPISASATPLSQRGPSTASLGLKVALSSAISARLHGCGAASSPKGSRSRPCSSLLVLFPIPGNFHARTVSFYL